MRKRNLDYNKLGIGYCSYEIGETWSTDLQVGMEKLGLLKIKKLPDLRHEDEENQIASIYGQMYQSQSQRQTFLSARWLQRPVPGLSQA
ncbi:MAG: hypothetical protein IPO37_25605 [Saprospiraceae bacterium]|nr:hypothetical protein [Saprospiraceae bacterium]